MRSGVLLLSPTALERLAHIDHVVFDKTGTLTLGRPELVDPPDRETVALAAGLAANSRHPLAKALQRAVPEAAAIDGVVEHPGLGPREGKNTAGLGRVSAVSPAPLRTDAPNCGWRGQASRPCALPSPTGCGPTRRP